MSKNFKTGDHLAAYRGVYVHHGIYIGQGQVIHYTGEVKDSLIGKNTIQVTSLARFSMGCKVRLVIHDDARYQGEEVVKRAQSRLGEKQYSLAFNNCEHFANWCIEGTSESDQVKAVAATAILGAASRHLAKGEMTRKAGVVLLSAGSQPEILRGSVVSAVSLIGAMSTGGKAGAVAGPAGLAVGLVCGLVTWGVSQLLG